MNITFDQTATLVRFATKTIVTSGAAAIISNAVKATTPADINRLKKITIWAGTAAISGMVAEHAGKRVTDAFDQTMKSVKKVIVEDSDDDDPDVVSGTVVD
jgi:phage-related tail fiber protein